MREKFFDEPFQTLTGKAETEYRQVYRHDIEGLRALAVVAVIANHASENLLPGGFLGVDIFFVISGYVITSSLQANPEARLTTFLCQFYARRLKRLFPALALSVLLTAFTVSLIDPNPGQRLKTGLSAILGVSNITLWAEGSNYFSSAIKTNPFMHTWSLGVEEQFYIFYPLLLWLGLTGKSGSLRVGLILSMAFGLSLAGFLLDQSRPVATFYLMPFRFWELAAGALLFLATSHRSPRSQPLVALVGLTMVVAALAIPPSLTPWSNVVVVAGTTVLIWTSGGMPAWVLSRPAAVLVGRLSYSLYLWHWPVLVLTSLTLGLNSATIIGATALTFLIAAGSYYLVETPLRHAKWEPRATLLGSGFAATSVATTLALLAWPLNGTLYTGRSANLIAVGVETLRDDYLVPSTTARWTARDCILTDNREVGKKIDADACTLTVDPESTKRVLVIGNSYSAAMAAGLDDVVARERAKVTLTSSWGASPIYTIPNDGPWSQANQYYWSSVVPQLIDDLSEGDWVLLVSDLNFLSPPLDAPPDTLRSASKLRQLLLDGINDFARSLSSKGIKLAILYGTAFVRDANCTPAQSFSQWYQPLAQKKCLVFSREETLARRAQLDRTLERASAEAGITVVNLFEVFCPDTMCDYTDPSGLMLYRDEFSHPSIEASRLAAPRIRAALFGT